MIKDLISGAQKYPIWARLALDDIISVNRRSVFGFLWEPISYIFMIAALSPLYASLMNIDLGSYIVYFSAGWLVWRLMSGLISSSCTTYIGAANYITQSKQPFSIYSYKLVLSHLYRFILNLPVFLTIIFIYSDIAGINILGVVGAMLLFIVMGFSLSITIGYLTLKFSDIRMVIDNIMRIAFFVTPVIWFDKVIVDLSAANLNIATKAAYLDYNPLYHYLIVMRSPLLGLEAPSHSLNIVSIVTVLSFIVALLILKKCQCNIPYLI